MPPRKLTETLTAFANADGGELYVGIDEMKRGGSKTYIWRGFVDPEDANGHIQAFEKLFPLGEYFECTLLECTGLQGLVLQGTVRKTPDIKRDASGKVRLRRNAMNLPVDTAEGLRRLELNKGIISYETERVQTELSSITRSVAVLRFIRDVVPSTEPEPWLRMQRLIVEDKPTVAGVLLFADIPQASLPKHSGVKIYRYHTSAEVGTRDTLTFDPLTVEGNLYEQIRGAVTKTKQVIERIPQMGVGGLEPVRYPEETLHEIITNAVLHRDYSIADDVHVRVFDNRIEVESPGSLPGTVTVRNILQERFARNGNVVRIINKFPNPPNKDVGEGLRTAFDAMRKLRLKEPSIEETASSVRVTIRHEPLASSEELVVNYLKEHGSINNRTARKLCAIPSENVMKRVFERLIASETIERIPGLRGKAIAYRLKDYVEDLFPDFGRGKPQDKQ